MDAYNSTNPKRKVAITFNPVGGSSDVVDLPNLNKLREQSRHLYRNSPIIKGGLDTKTRHTLGSGLTLQSTPDAEMLGITAEEARQWARQVEAYWQIWTNSSLCDWERIKNFYEIQKVAFMTAIIGGDTPFILPLDMEQDNKLFSLSIRLFEPERITNPYNSFDTEKIAGGVEVDKGGRVVAYHIAKKDPKGLNSYGAYETIRIPLYGDVRKNIHILSKYGRPHQRRGIPELAPVIETIKQLTDYTTAELGATLVSALFTVFITKNNDFEPDLTVDDNNMLSSDITSDNNMLGDITDKGGVELGSGNVVELEEGEKIEIANPNRPNPNFEKFIEAVLKEVGASIGLPYEILVQHFSRSYSASRGAFLLAWKTFLQDRKWFIRGFIMPVYEAFLENLIINNYIEANGFLDNPLMRNAWLKSNWNGTAQGQLDPVRETKAAQMRVEAGFSTRTEETAEIKGGDFEQNAKIRAIEEELMRNITKNN